MPLDEETKQFISEEIQRLATGDIDQQTPDVQQVREIIREEVPALLKMSVTTIEGNLQLKDSRNIIVGTVTGSKIATATNQKLGFFNAAPIVQQTDGADLTNSVASGGSDNVIANYTDLNTYSTDAAAIRNNFYQLARKVKIIGDALRDYGFLS